MLFKKIHTVINVPFMTFKHDIFLCFQFICCAFCSDLKNENMRDSVQRGCKKWRSIEISFFKFYLTIQYWDSFQKSQHARNKDYKMLFIYFLVTDLKKKTQNTNHINNLLLLKSSLLLLVLNREGSSKYFLV